VQERGGRAPPRPAVGGSGGCGVGATPPGAWAGAGGGGIVVLVADLMAEVVDSCPPCVYIVKPNIDNDNDNKDDKDNDNNDKGAVSKGGGMTNKWDFEEFARRRRATEDNAMVQEVGGVGGMATCKDVVLWLESYCIHRN
jgi:hypothetical protein